MWLNPKGVREQTLKSIIQKYHEAIAFNMKKRNQEIINLMNQAERSRSSSRRKAHGDYHAESYMQYVNRWK